MKYLTYTPLIYAYGVVMVSKKYFEKIPAEHRPVVKEVFARGLKEIKAKTRQGNHDALETLKKEGIQILPVSPEAYEALARLADEANLELEKKKVFSGELLRTLKAHLHEYRTGKDKATPQGNTKPQGKEKPNAAEPKSHLNSLTQALSQRERDLWFSQRSCKAEPGS